MNITALNSNAVAIALAAISFAGSAGAGPLLCEDLTPHASVQSSCAYSDSYYVKNKHRIDYLFDAGAPATPSVLWHDWSSFEVKFKLDERQLQLWHPLWSSGGLNFGRVFGDGGKWTRPQFQGGQPSRNVPEPGSLVLLSIGLVGAALSRRLKRS